MRVGVSYEFSRDGVDRVGVGAEGGVFHVVEGEDVRAGPHGVSEGEHGFHGGSLTSLCYPA